MMPQWNRTGSEGNLRFTVYKEPKTQERQRSEESSAMQEKSLNFKTALKKKLLLTVKKTNHEWQNYNFQCYCVKAVFSTTSAYYSEEDRHRSHALEKKHRTAFVWVRSGHFNQVWWAFIVISMRYYTGCGEACWNSLRHCVSLIDLLCFIILF